MFKKEHIADVIKGIIIVIISTIIIKKLSK